MTSYPSIPAPDARLETGQEATGNGCPWDTPDARCRP